MGDGLARHMTKYLHAGFWTAVVAAVLNGTYWRLPVPLSVQRSLAGITAAVAVAAVVLNGRLLWQRNISGGRTGRRVTWLLFITGILVVGSVLIGLTDNGYYSGSR